MIQRRPELLTGASEYSPSSSIRVGSFEDSVSDAASKAEKRVALVSNQLLVQDALLGGRGGQFQLG